MFNEDSQYAASRIIGSWMRLKKFEAGGIFRVDDFGAPQEVGAFKGTSLHGRDKLYRNITVTPEDLSFVFGPLGYVNTSDSTHFVVRTPQKKNYKQGVRAESLLVSSKSKLIGLSEKQFSALSFIKGLAECIHGVYPSLGSAENLLEERGGAIAISRNFAVSDASDLFYRGELAGKLLGDSSFKLKPEFKFAEQQLAEELGNDANNLS